MSGAAAAWYGFRPFDPRKSFEWKPNPTDAMVGQRHDGAGPDKRFFTQA